MKPIIHHQHLPYTHKIISFPRLHGTMAIHASSLYIKSFIIHHRSESHRHYRRSVIKSISLVAHQLVADIFGIALEALSQGHVVLASGAVVFGEDLHYL